MKVGVIMGSTSDWEVMSGAAETLAEFGVEFENASSAHTVPPI